MNTDKKITQEAEKHILNGKNEVYIKLTFGKDVNSMYDIHFEANCTKAQMLLALICLSSKIEREMVGFAQGILSESVAKFDCSEENMLKIAKQILEEEKDGKTGNL